MATICLGQRRGVLGWDGRPGGGGVQCWVRVHLLMPPGVPLEDEWDHSCGSLEPVLDSGSNV